MENPCWVQSQSSCSPWPASSGLLCPQPGSTEPRVPRMPGTIQSTWYPLSLVTPHLERSGGCSGGSESLATAAERVPQGRSSLAGCSRATRKQHQQEVGGVQLSSAPGLGTYRWLGYLPRGFCSIRIRPWILGTQQWPIDLSPVFKEPTHDTHGLEAPDGQGVSKSSLHPQHPT